MAASDELKKLAEQLLALQSAAQLADDSIASSINVLKKYATEQATVDAQTKKLSDQIEARYAQEIELLNQNFKANDKLMVKEKQRLNELIKLDKLNATQGAVLKELNKTNQGRLQALREEALIAKGLGKNLSAAWLEFKDKFRNQSTGKVDAGHATAAVIGVAQDPLGALTAIPGWGVLIKLIVDVFDKTRRLTGELSAASAAGGDFVGSMEKASKEAMTLSVAGVGLDTLGFSVDELAETFKTLKGTGIRAFGEMSGALTTHAKAVIAYSKAAGESQEAVAQRMASLVRNFGVQAGDVEGTYTELIDSAIHAAKKGYTTTAGYMSMVQSLGEAFADTGVSILGVNKILSSVGSTMEKLGRPMQNMQKIASGIMGITKAGEGWQVFMARMSGVQGGYAATLFKAQQRGPNGQLAKAGEMDPAKYVQMARNMLLKPTAGIADQSTRQLMIEKLGSQMGMDTETTQVFQKMSAGKMGAGEAGTTLKKLWDESKKQNMSTKGMFDIIKNILTNLIALPVLGMYSIMKATAGIFGAGDSKESLDSTIEQALSGETHARGAKRVTQAGMVRVGAGEGLGVGGNAITPVGKMAKTTPYSGGGGGLSINLNGNFQVDPSNLAKVHKQFDKMLQDGLSNLQDRMMSNTAT